ncbi:hypothetical protein [Azotobacter armeniacus]
MPHPKSCRKAAQAPVGLKKAPADLESGPLALAINIGLLALAALILIEVARHG